MTSASVTAPQHDVRPARRRDLALIGAGEEGGDGFVMVAGDPPVAAVHVDLLDGHPHLGRLTVEPGQDEVALRTALVEAACERLSVRGFGQVTALTGAGSSWDRTSLSDLGFAPVPADEELPGPLARLMARSPADAVLERRVLRRHRTTQELTTFLPRLDSGPRDRGTLRLLVRRPAEGAREVLDVGHLDLRAGLVGDNWIDRTSKRTPDRGPHPDMQLNIMNHALIEFLAQEPEREALSGDQLFLDLDLSHENLPAWSELHIGGPEGAVIVVTDQPHTGCGKFIARYGKDAMTFVNTPDGKARRLRGLCAKVVRPGPVRPGDEVVVVRP